MKVESLNIAGGSPMPLPRSAEKVDAARKQKEDVQAVETPKIQPEELLTQIKALTDNGLNSVRFENDERSNQLVVKIINRETDEVVRQIPAEEILQLKATMDDLIGNLVDTQS